jgi:hypothetical protein
MTPSPFSRLASGAVSGLLSGLAQTIAGIKTFTSAIIASAGIQVASLWNTNGTGASDVVLKVGTTAADASVNAAAKLWALYTGIGGTEVLKLWVDKQGDIRSSAINTGRLRGSSASGGMLGADDSSGAFVKFNTVAMVVDSSSVTFSESGSFGNILRIGSAGMFSQAGADSTGTPGAATINKPVGKSAIAVGASSVVITNSLVTAASHVVFSPHARDATCKELTVVAAAGSFTVSGTANATASLPFSWRVATML